MGVDPSGSGRRRRRLPANEKHEVYRHALTGQATQREAAERRTVHRWTVVHVWRRRERGELADRAPGGAALHGLLDAERAAIQARQYGIDYRRTQRWPPA